MSAERCAFARELKAWIDGELAPARARELAAHVATCADCAEEAEDFRRLSALLARAQGAQPCAGGARRIRQLAVSARREEDRAVRLLQLTAAAAVLLMATVLAVAWPVEPRASPIAGPPYVLDRIAAQAESVARAVDPEYVHLGAHTGNPFELPASLHLQEE